MKIAIAQINTCEGDFIQTTSKMERCAVEAQEKGAEFIIFPLPVLTGPLAGVLASSDEFLFDTLNTFANLASVLPISALVPVATDIDDDSVYDVALVADGHVQPLRLSSVVEDLVDNLEENLKKLPQFAPIAFSLGEIDFGIIFNQEGLSSYAESTADADVVIYLNGLGFDNDDVLTNLAPAINDGYFVHEAQKTDSWIIGVGGVGGYAEQVFSGGSFVMAPTGELVSVSAVFEEELSVVDIDVESSVSSIEKVEAPVYDRIGYLQKALLLAISEFCVKQNKEKVVVPLYGDMSTSVLVSLAAKACGADKVCGVVPSFVVGQDLEDALLLCQRLGVDVEMPDLGSTFDLGLMPLFLAQYSSATNSVILVPDDKTSLALESDEHEVRCVRSFAPFGDVYKSDVLAMAQRLFEEDGLIEASSIHNFKVPVVEGVNSSLTDVENLSQIDAILYLHVEGDLGITSIVAKQKSEVLTSSVIGKMRSGDYARRFMPIMPIVSARTLAECEYPIGIGWSDRTRDDFDIDEFKELQQDLIGMLGVGEEEEQDPSIPLNIQAQLSGNMPQDVEGMISNILGALQTTMPQDNSVDGLNLFSKN